MITADQIRAARALLQWSQSELAEKSGVSVPTIANIETERQRPNEETLRKINKTFHLAELEFIDGGVRKNPNVVTIFEGADCYARFQEKAIAELLATGGEFLLSASADSRSPPIVIEQQRLMYRMGIKQRQLIMEGDTYIMGPLEDYRYLPKRVFGGDCKVIYNSNVAYAIVRPNVHRIVVLHDEWVADEARRTFEFFWDIGAKPTHTTCPISLLD